MNHAYGVRMICPDPRAKAYFRPWCECGWSGVLTMDEHEAAGEAYTHATGKEPEKTVRVRKPKELQTDVLFDRAEYERKRWE